MRIRLCVSFERDKSLIHFEIFIFNWIRAKES